MGKSPAPQKKPEVKERANHDCHDQLQDASDHGLVLGSFDQRRTGEHNEEAGRKV
jgi:hypothetical protein